MGNSIKPSIPILYEDGHCLVFNKPAGLLVIPTEKGERHTLSQLAKDYGADLLPVHRLDRDTSGAILFAKGSQVREKLMAFFKERRVNKTYIAFVHGRVKSPKGQISIPIKDFHQRKFARHLPAQSALTCYEVEDYYKDFTVVKIMPITGRTNQIRIHFAKIGHPLVGEDKYAFRRDFDLRFRRVALHALRLEWPRMEGKGALSVEAPLAADMVGFLKKHNGFIGKETS